MEFVKAMKIKSEICKAYSECPECPLKGCSAFMTQHSEEAEKIFEDWELDAEWRTLPKGSIILVDDYAIGIFDHYKAQTKEVVYVTSGILTGVLASAPIHHCKIYEVGDYDG